MPRDPSGILDVSVSLGPCDELRAEVYVRAVVDADAAGGSPRPRLEGTLSGPECRYATTLPSSARLVDLGGGGSPQALVGRVVLTEPSFWTPQVPSLYRLDVRLLAGTTDLAACTRHVGLRRLGVRRRSLWLDGHRWVPRGVGMSADAVDPGTLREHAATAIVDAPADELLARTDREGVALIARLPHAAPLAEHLTVCETLLAKWSLHPSVALAVVPLGWPPAVVGSLAVGTRRARGTMLLAEAVSGANPPAAGTGCDALFVELPEGGVPADSWRVPPGVPLLACRTTAAADLPGRRRACDRLQADLAAWGLDGGDARPWDWAGYAVI